MENWFTFFQVRDNLVGSTLVDLCEIWWGGSLRVKLWDKQEKLTRALVLLVPLIVLDSKSTSLGAGIQMWVQAVQYNLFSSGVFFPYFSLLILSLPLLGLGSKSISLSPGFCVHTPRQYNTICWKLNLISRLFAFFWLIVFVDDINKCCWFLAGDRGYWLMGQHQISSLSWIFHHSSHFHIY